MSLTILPGDCVEQMRTLPADTVQLCVTSPPYDGLRTYGGDCQWDFQATALELYRVLVPGGVVCWNVGDSTLDGSETLTSCKQKIFFREQAGFIIHDTMIWQKVHVAAPNARHYHQMFEYIFVLGKGRITTFNPLVDKPNKFAGAAPFSYNSKRLVNGDIKRTREQADRGVIADFGRRSNVWTGNSRAQESPCQTLPHPAMMPKWLARDLILSFSNPGDTVLDPFLGSGTAAIAALETGRNAIGIEISEEYCALARQLCHVTPGLALQETFAPD
jgi:DNA modification methylase